MAEPMDWSATVSAGFYSQFSAVLATAAVTALVLVLQLHSSSSRDHDPSEESISHEAATRLLLGSFVTSLFAALLWAVAAGEPSGSGLLTISYLGPSALTILSSVQLFVALAWLIAHRLGSLDEMARTVLRIVATFAGVWVGLTAISAVDAARPIEGTASTMTSLASALLGGVAGLAVTVRRRGREVMRAETALPLMTKAVVIVGAFATSWFILIGVWPYDSGLASGNASTLEVVIVAVLNALVAAGLFACMFLLFRSLPNSVRGYGPREPSPALDDAALPDPPPEGPPQPNPDDP